MRRTEITVLLVIRAWIAILAIDMLGPALPALTEDLDVSSNVIQFGLSAGLAVFTAGFLVFGLLIDRYGRRPILLGGSIALSLAGMLAGLAPTASVFITGLLLLYLGGSASLVAARVILRDLFDGKAYIKALAHVNAAITFAPFIAPMLGSYLLVAFGWRATLLAVVPIGLLFVVVLWARLPETLSPTQMKQYRFRHSIAVQFSLLTRSSFTVPVVILSAAQAAVGAGSLAMPFLFIDELEITPVTYSYLLAGMLVVSMAGAHLSGILVEHISEARVGLISLGLITLGAVMLLYFGFSVATPWIPLFVAFTLVMAGNAMLIPIYTAKALVLPARRRGAGVVVLGTCQTGAWAVAGVLMSIVYTGAVLPVAILVSGCVALALVGQVILANNTYHSIERDNEYAKERVV